MHILQISSIFLAILTYCNACEHSNDQDHIYSDSILNTMNGIHVQKCIDIAKHTTISDKAIKRLYGSISESSNITHDIEEDNSVIYDLAHAILSYLLYSYSEIENLNNILPNIHFNKLALQSTYETL